MSNFVVSARKYRPARFDEVVGQEHVSQTLKNALQNDHLAHAFLFCGPRGVGKTTCARILAKTLNCTNRTKDFEACNECDSCSAFNGSASFNITELDAASNNSVEHIRTLVEQVRFQPQQGKYKVFIIDEVHMLSQAAFNAFLKTLEEPPPYAIFILATTEKHKIIPTILSRCQIFDFKRIQVSRMVDHLKGICKTEGIKAEDDALHVIAQKADGALRDALSIFDRIVSSTGKQITYDDVITNLNVLDYDYFFNMTDAMMGEDLSNVMLIFDKVQRNGFDSDLFINGFAEHLRNILVAKDEQTIQLLDVSDKIKERYVTQSKVAPKTFLLTALNIANDCDVNYKMARNKRLHVEMSLIKMAYINRAVELAQNPPAAPVVKNRTANVEKISINKPVEPIRTNRVEEPVEEIKASIPIKPEVKPVSNGIAAKEKKPVAKTSKLGKTVLPNSSKHSAFKIPTFDELKEQVNADDKEKEERVSLLSPENLEQFWKEYFAKVTSPSLKNVAKNAQLTIEGTDKIFVTVNSTMAKGLIQEELELMGFLRDKLQHEKIIIEIKIDTTKAPIDTKPKPTKLSTPKEKYEKMKEINPLVEELRVKFDLKLDNN